MSVILGTLVIVIILKVAYDWYRFLEKKKKLEWLPSIPGWPVIGIALEFEDTSGKYFSYKLLEHIVQYEKINLVWLIIHQYWIVYKKI